jgi:replicative DNA helicase
MSVGLHFLSAVVAHGSTSALRNLDESHFVDDDEVEAFQYLCRHLERYGEIASADAVFEVTGVNLPDVTDSVDYHRERLFDRKFHNDVRDPYNALRDALAEQRTGDAREAAHALYAVSMDSRPTADLLTISGAGESMLERYAQNHLRPGVTGIPTGWDRLDEDTGGYQSGDLIVWVGRPGTGKTWLMLWQLRAAVESGASVLFVSMEMPLDQIAARYFGMISGIDVRLIRRGQLSTRTEARLRGRVQEYERIANRFHLYAGNMGQTTAELNAVVVELNPDIVYVDGLYLLRSPKAHRNADRNSHVAYAVDDLKRMSLVRNIPVVGSTQFNRQAGSGGRRGNLETIGFTDALGQNTSLVYSVKQVPRRASNQNALIVTTEKGREGERADMAIAFEFHPVNFEQIDLSQAQDPADRNVDLEWMQ